VILVTHGHGDHTDNVAELAKRTGTPVFGPAGLITTMIDLGWVTPEKGVRFGKGGRVNPLGPHITITQVRAEHSPEVTVTDPTIKKSTTYPGGEPCGFIVDPCDAAYATKGTPQEYQAALGQTPTQIFPISPGGKLTF
jgi:L-ascorbate metabolism protein UlaG (beta-lactamase superfamily)